MLASAKKKSKIISVSRTNPLYGEDHILENGEKVFQERSEEEDRENKIKNVPTTSSSSGYSSNQRLPLPQVTNLHGAMNSNDNDDEGMVVLYKNS